MPPFERKELRDKDQISGIEVNFVQSAKDGFDIVPVFRVSSSTYTYPYENTAGFIRTKTELEPASDFSKSLLDVHFGVKEVVDFLKDKMLITKLAYGPSGIFVVTPKETIPNKDTGDERHSVFAADILDIFMQKRDGFLIFPDKSMADKLQESAILAQRKDFFDRIRQQQKKGLNFGTAHSVDQPKRRASWY